MITLLTKKNGKTVLNTHAKAGVSVEDICDLAKCEVNGNYADYALVKVDGVIYAEYDGPVYEDYYM